MIGIKGVFKWIAGIVSGILYAGNAIYNYHTNQIQAAVTAALDDVALTQQELRDEVEEELRGLAEADIEAIRQELKAERARSKDLERMLLVDHDLDRLLQRKPGLIITRVNAGTEAYAERLREATQ